MSASSLDQWIPKRWHPLFTSLLQQRNILEEQYQSFFVPDITQIAPVEALYAVQEAARQINEAVKQGKQITVYGDYDADGVCATAVLWEYLYRECNAQVLPYIPSRFEHGYGLNDQALAELAEKGAELIITVDCGVRDHELITKWQKKGLSFVVSDHHQPGDVLPPCTVVHPLHPDGQFPNKLTSGAVVAWYLVLAMISQHRPLQAADYQGYGVDLAGLSLVTDMMPLLGDNRAIVRTSLEVFREHCRPGLRALLDDAQVSVQDVTAYHFGYIIGPRLNAAGRLGDALEALRLLVTNDVVRSRHLSKTLSTINSQRQKLTEDILADIKGSLDSHLQTTHLFAVGEGWNEGVVGLVAGKLQDTYKVPTFVAAQHGDEIRGSARSIPGVHIVELLGKVEKHMTRYGGHAAAAGFSTTAQKLPALQKALARELKKVQPSTPTEDIIHDAELTATELTLELLELLTLLEPHGIDNPVPRFSVIEGTLQDFRLVGSTQDHLAFRFTNTQGDLIKAIMFRGKDLYNQLQPNQSITVIGRLAIDEWNGRRQVQIIVDKVL